MTPERYAGFLCERDEYKDAASDAKKEFELVKKELELAKKELELVKKELELDRKELELAKKEQADTEQENTVLMTEAQEAEFIARHFI